ncbi:MAG TPA: sulfatase-like hydrolase/transferase [Chloroflexota bacterium]|nr:sulfatase-like hydrolase/transferase [Chloroflexota bacterium]
MPQPHVLFFMCDQLQYQRQGTVDPVAYTPNLDRLAAEGVAFTQHYCANSQCVPSRASLQTGRYPHELGVMIIYGFHGHTGRLSGAERTVGQVFREAGYTTAYFGKTHFGTPLAQLGYDVGSEGAARPPHSAGDRAIVDEALAFLAGYDPAQPLFLTVSLHEPHPPFELVEAFADHYPLERLAAPASYWLDDLTTKPPFQREHATDKHTYADEAALLDELRQYYTMISHVDALFGEVRDALAAKGMWANTAAAFTSDHGDMMGAHRLRLKGTLPYDELYRVPLTIRVPAAQFPRQVVDDLTVNVSVPGTLLEAAGLALPPAFAGSSLLPAMRRAMPPADEAIYFEHYGAYWGLHPFRAVRTRRWKYIKHYGPDQTDELYDMIADPLELRSVADDPALSAIKAGLERQVDEWWAATGGRDFVYYESPEFKARGVLPLTSGAATSRINATSE